MTLNQEDYFILMQTIRGIKERLDHMHSDDDEEMLDEIKGMIDGLRDIVIELSKELEK